jgi:hypothetical protein
MNTWLLTLAAAGHAKKRTGLTTSSGASGAICPSADSGGAQNASAVIAVRARGHFAFTGEQEMTSQVHPAGQFVGNRIRLR